jgi:hypothetical protein
MKYVAAKEFDSSVVINGAYCVTSMKDLYSCIIEKDATELEIRKDFAEEFFTPASLAEFVKNVKEINPTLQVTTSVTTQNFLTEQVQKLSDIKDTSEFIYVLEKNPNDVFSLIKELTDFYMGAYSETLEANNKVSTQHLKIASLQRQLAEKQSAYDDLLKREQEVESRLHILISRINYQYGHNINMDTLLDAAGNRYDKVLYIKEVSRVHYTDTFIYYLQEIMRTLYSVPCRLCVMEPFYAYDNIRLYKDLKPSWDLTAEDVYSSDVFMAGYQPTLVQDILKNPSNIRYLIFLDRAGGSQVHITGDNVETYYCVSDEKDMEDFEDKSRIISYSTETSNIPHIPGFDQKTNEEKMGAYSSMPLMQRVIDVMEER